MTTITVLTKAPIAGSTKTRLAPAIGLDGAARLHEAFVDATLDKLRHTGFHLQVAVGHDPGGHFARTLRSRGIHTLPQAEGDLGARMRAVLMGPGRRIVIGTDCLVFDPTWLTVPPSAPVAIAPSEDGGYWALSIDGTASSEVLDDLFVDVPWSTPKVLPLTLARCAQRGTPVELLPTCYDVDTPAELSRLLHDPRCPPRVRARLESLSCPS